MFDYFVFPVNFNDIEQESTTLNRHRVILVDVTSSDRDTIRKLKHIDSAFNQNYENITDPDNFDFLYSLIKAFSENIECKSMGVLEQLSSTVQYITEHMLKHLQHLNEDCNTSKLRIAFKMVMFLCLYFVSATSLKKQKTQGDLITQTMNREKGRRKQKNENYEPTRLLIENQKNCISLIKETLKINFVVLWEKKEMDTEFFKKYVDVCVKILQSNLAKEEDVSQCIFDILETILNSKECETIASTFQTVLANLVYEGDVIDNLVNFFANAKGPELQKLITQALTLVVIYLVNKQNLNSESQSIKNTKEFLSKLSEKIPKTFHTNLSCFIVLLKHESYYLRNAIADIMANIFKLVLSGEENEQLYKQSREKFITTLLQRIYDKSSFCRTHVLGILAQLTTEKIVDKKYLILFLKAGIDRVKDQSINVRKRALQLINVAIDELCTGQTNNLTDIERQIQLAELELKTLNEEEQKLKGYIDQAEDEETLEQLVNDVKLIKKQIKVIEEKEMNMFEMKELNNLINKVIESTRILLGSKADTDVLETIKLFIKLHKLNFPKAKESLPDIRILIFSKEKKIKDEVLTNFIYLHLSNKSEEVAKELVTLFAKANPQDQSALEEILETIIAESVSKSITIIKPQAFAHMWNHFIKYEREQTNQSEKRAIITILRIAFSKDHSLIKEENIESFLNMLKAYTENNQPDFHIVKEISKIICLDTPSICKVAKNFLVAQIYILVNTQGTPNNEWFSACECILTCIFKICESPEKLSELLLKKLHQKLEKDKSTKSLCHFIFTLSHTSLKCLIYLDSIQSKIKGIKQKQLMQQSNQNQQQLDKVMGGVEAELQSKIQQIQILAQKILEDPFINRWLNIIEKIVVNFKDNSELETISVLAYCKFLCLSAPFCEQKFPHIVKLLNSNNVNSVVKNNIIIAMGDLLHRFPNIIEPYNRHLYQNLHERDPRVRKTTLTVITHLSLNDMIKVKSDMCDVALLFQDPDPQIESLVKQFFHQMNKKDPKTLFNLIPDALTRFSNVQKLNNESTFKVFLQNILPLLEKDKYSQSLVIKLCERLSNSLNMLEIANTAYCLSEININEKGLRKIIQNFESFRKTLENAEVLQCFKNLLTKLKKSQKTDIKPLIEELQEKVSHSGQEVFNADQIRKRNQEKLLKKQPRKKPENLSNKRTARRKKAADDDEEMDIEENQPSQNAPRNRPQRTGKRMRVIQESQDEYEDMEDEDYAESQ